MFHTRRSKFLQIEVCQYLIGVKKPTHSKKNSRLWCHLHMPKNCVNIHFQMLTIFHIKSIKFYFPLIFYYFLYCFRKKEQAVGFIMVITEQFQKKLYEWATYDFNQKLKLCNSLRKIQLPIIIKTNKETTFELPTIRGVGGLDGVQALHCTKEQ